MALRNLLQTWGSPKSLVNLLGRQYNRYSKVEPKNITDWIRASSLAYICPREEVIAAREKRTRKDEIESDLLLCFDLGHGMHWAMQNRVLPGLGILQGAWQCTQCGNLVGALPPKQKAEVDALRELHGKAFDSERFRELMQLQKAAQVLRPKSCESCGVEEEDGGDWSPFLYEEQWYGWEECRVGGHPDGFLRLPWRDGIGELELKSMSSGRIGLVKKMPLHEHVAQVHVYMEAAECDWTLILYWDKGTFGLKGLVEHYVTKDRDTSDEIRAQISGIWAGLERVHVPDRMCQAIDCARAKKCSMSTACFGSYA